MSNQVNSLRRRWWQFSLRTLLVCMLLVSLPLAALANWLNQVRQRRVAVAEIHKLGGNTMECHLLETGPDWSSYCPGRLHDMLGDDFFLSYNYAELSGNTFHDQHLASLRSFPQLRTLYLNDSQITDDGLKHLQALGQLRSLSVSGTRITDHGLISISKLKNLRYLDLSRTQITDAGLKELLTLTELEHLVVGSTSISDVGLSHVKQFAKLEVLNISKTKVTDAGLRQLHGMRSLEWIYLHSLNTSDSAVQELKNALPKLTVFCEDDSEP